MTRHICTTGLIDEVWRLENIARVAYRGGYASHVIGHVACALEDTGNGFIAHLPSSSATRQDKYVCLDYDEARNLILALSEFKKELGFTEQSGDRG